MWRPGLALGLLWLVVVQTVAVRVRQGDCPLCVAEEQCHEACARIWQKAPGSYSCLQACIGAHPDDDFDRPYFDRADRKMKASAQLDANIRRLGEELAADARAAGGAA
uniref:Uncharacterized protein n=1 Tax=Alexandrium andersonii TaxID=327968 RepID=A0A7S2AEK6_9DINO